MSNIKVNSITGVGSGGFTGTVASEGGAATTDLQQGLAKAWARLNPNTLQDSLNTASILDNGTGDFEYNFTNNMNNANYSLFGSGNSLTGNQGVCITNSNANNENSASLCRFIYTAGDGPDTADDPGYAYYLVAGDLA
tara:strand:- start:840 stop:1253 length:414 start_codon:yes stop_codon:yes gene_type:complete